MYWLKCNLLSRIVIRIYLDSDDIKKELNEQEIVIVNRKAATLYNVLAAKSPLQLTKPGAATSYNSRGGLSFAHLFSGSTPAHAMIIHKTASFVIHHISHFSMFPMALGTM